MSRQQLDTESLDLIFNEARSFSYWQDKSVDKGMLHKLYDIMKMGPTAANSCPLRVVFLTTDEAKQKLKPALAEGNVDKSMAAPVVAVLAMDMEFYEHLPTLFPHTDARSWFAGNDKKIAHSALLNSSLQSAYFIVAARSLGLDCGPMSGFDADKMNEIFFADSSWKVNIICALGYGDKDKLHPRSPRLAFDDACRIL